MLLLIFVCSATALVCQIAVSGNSRSCLRAQIYQFWAAAVGTESSTVGAHIGGYLKSICRKPCGIRGSAS